MNPVIMSLLLLAALTVFGRTIYRKIRLLMALGPADRTNHLKERLAGMLILAVGQKRLVGRARERGPGIVHAFIFWGFCVLLIRSLNIYGEGFHEGFHLPLLNDKHLLGYLYIGLKDIMEGIVLLMVLISFYRRAVVRPERLHNSFEAYLVLGLIGVLMVSDLLYDGARHNLIQLYGNPGNIHYFNNPAYGSEFAWTPLSVGAASLVAGWGASANATVLTIMFWLHVCTQLVFLNLLPLGKHFHVITALPNVFLKSLGYPHEKPRLLALEDEAAWEEESLGINHIHQLNWKQGLDLFTCTECGRCKEVCPTHITEKPLNLFDFNNRLKHELLENADPIIARARLTAAMGRTEDTQRIERLKEEAAGLNSQKPLIGEVIAEDTLWACTTCRACEQVCPVTIEHVPRIIAMRQGQTLMAESYPKELNAALKGLERNGNPWGIGYDKRADWAQGLNVKTMAEAPQADYLLWVGCAGAFDDRTKKVTISLVKILQKAGVRFAILGVEEKCTGDFARRAGNEMMFQMMAEQNIETLNRYHVQKIITACPHCLNALKHDYPQMGGHYEVIHHAEFIHGLVREGKISLSASLEGDLTYHDPCYLGRYNEVYDQPRAILGALSKNGVKELRRHGRESFCCGAGGGRMWMEETIGKRINLERSEEIIGRRVSNVAVGCPFCLTMIEDGMKELDKQEDIRTLDIAELVEKHMR
ncbi:MAG: (Fe-S)-binding protein [Desulfatitalea sp.]|nr:(Fe-S)-binding protein [Desulfatitalea sp.]NNK00570.1 (Fe-S)-binding protein [Desulfatitalea sp.]